MSIRQEFFENPAACRPRCITGSPAHDDPAAVLIGRCRPRLREVRWASGNIFSTQINAAAAIAQNGFKGQARRSRGQGSHRSAD